MSFRNAAYGATISSSNGSGLTRFAQVAQKTSSYMNILGFANAGSRSSSVQSVRKSIPLRDKALFRSNPNF